MKLIFVPTIIHKVVAFLSPSLLPKNNAPSGPIGLNAYRRNFSITKVALKLKTIKRIGNYHP